MKLFGTILVALGVLLAILDLVLAPPQVHPKLLTIATILIGVGVLLGAESIQVAAKGG